MVDNYNEVLYDNEIITTNRLVLRKFMKEDAQGILEYGSDPTTLRYLDWTGVMTIADAQKVISNYYWSKPGIYAIEVREIRKCIGGIDLRIDPEHEKISFGYVLNRKYWNAGYMTEALSALLRLCFEKLQVNRVEAYHYGGNEASGKVMEKCGMKFEGMGKQERKVKDIFYDVFHYGITKEDWHVVVK